MQYISTRDHIFLLSHASQCRGNPQTAHDVELTKMGAPLAVGLTPKCHGRVRALKCLARRRYPALVGGSRPGGLNRRARLLLLTSAAEGYTAWRMMVELWPPSPMELESAVLTRCSRATCGT